MGNLLTLIETYLNQIIAIIGMIVAVVTAIVLGYAKIKKLIQDTLSGEITKLEIYQDAKSELERRITGYITTAAVNPEKLLKTIKDKAEINLNTGHLPNLNPIVAKVVQEHDKKLLDLMGIGHYNLATISKVVQSIYNGIKPAIKLLRK